MPERAVCGFVNEQVALLFPVFERLFENIIVIGGYDHLVTISKPHAAASCRQSRQQYMHRTWLEVAVEQLVELFVKCSLRVFVFDVLRDTYEIKHPPFAGGELTHPCQVLRQLPAAG